MTSDSFPIPESVVKAAAKALFENRPREMVPTPLTDIARPVLQAALTAWGATVESGFIDGEHPIKRDPAQRIVTPWEAGS